MKVLFLGGPWHNERHDVTPGRSASAAGSLPMYFNVPLLVDDAEPSSGMATALPRPRRHVTYTRRFARGNGGRIPVYVSPEYHGPARA